MADIFMAGDATSRLGLPLLDAGQAQKEVTHNEALTRLDFLVQTVVQAVGTIDPPATPDDGQAWIVGRGGSGAWNGRDAMIAAWTPGGWRYAPAQEGMAVWSIADTGVARYRGGTWTIAGQGAAIAAPDGGSVIDGEARVAIAAMLAVMRRQGLIAN